MESTTILGISLAGAVMLITILIVRTWTLLRRQKLCNIVDNIFADIMNPSIESGFIEINKNGLLPGKAIAYKKEMEEATFNMGGGITIYIVSSPTKCHVVLVKDYLESTQKIIYKRSVVIKGV